MSGLRGVEVNVVKWQAIVRRSAGHRMRRVEDELPLSLPEEQGDGEVKRDERRHHHQADAGEDPVMRYQGIAGTQGIVEV